MKLDLPAGKYVVAVSGGVDSMVLLHLLVQKHQSLASAHQSPVQKNGHRAASNLGRTTSDSSSLELVVAHFNHGTRAGSGEDEKFVRQAAKNYVLPFTAGRAELGPKASEDVARQARYRFLQKVALEQAADCILTAHHQDDLLETAIINTMRGTGWRGLVAMLGNPRVGRPLAGYSKVQILDYATKNRLVWREDPTNQQTDYLRNRIRKTVMPKLKPADRQRLLKSIDELAARSAPIGEGLERLSRSVGSSGSISRRTFSSLPSIVADELMHQYLRSAGIADVDRATVERLSIAVKAAKPGTVHNAGGGRRLEVGKEIVSLL